MNYPLNYDFMNWSQSKIRFCLKIFDGFIGHFLRCSLYKAERKYFFLGQNLSLFRGNPPLNWSREVWKRLWRSFKWFHHWKSRKHCQVSSQLAGENFESTAKRAEQNRTKFNSPPKRIPIFSDVGQKLIDLMEKRNTKRILEVLWTILLLRILEKIADWGHI